MPLQARDRLFDALIGLAGRPGARLLLTGPVDLDGDSIGACLALRRVLGRYGVRAEVAGDLPWRYDGIPEADSLVPDALIEPVYHAVVVLDGDRHRLTPTVAAAFEAANLRGLVDHHASTRTDGYTHPWLIPHATSTCEMLYSLFLDRGEAFDATLAAQLHAGSIFDTGGFRHANTSPATFRMAANLVELGADHVGLFNRILVDRTAAGLALAGEVFASARDFSDGRVKMAHVPLARQQALGVVAGDLEGLVEGLLHVLGVEASALLIEKPGGKVKVSLRSRGGIDVSAVAAALAPCGGGHPRAAGVTLAVAPEAAEVLVANTLAAALQGAFAAPAARLA